MCLGGYTGLKRSLVYLVCFSFIIVTYQRPAHANPIIPLLNLARLYDSAVVSRYFQSINGEAVTLARLEEIMANTENAIGTSIIDGVIQFKPSTWEVNGLLPWGAVAVAMNESLLSDPDFSFSTDTEEVAFISDGVPNGDGTYTVMMNGKPETVTYKPNIKNPVIVSRPITTSTTPNNPTPTTGVIETSSPSDDYHYYYYDMTLNKFLNSNTSIDVATQAVKNIFNNNKYYDTTYKTIQDHKFLIKECSLTFNYSGSLGELYGKLQETIHVGGSCKSLNTNFVFYTYDDVSDRLIFNKTSSSDYMNSKVDIDRTVNVTINPRYKDEVVTPISFGSVEQMMSHLTPLKDKKLPVSLVTSLLNQMMFKASSRSDYKGIPFDSTSLFTENEIEEIMKNSNFYPTYYDLFTVATDSSGVIQFGLKDFAINFYNIYYGGNNSSGGDGGGSGSENLGKFEPPDIEQPPDNFFDSYDDMFAFLRDFKIDEKKADCPIVSFEVFDHKYVIDTHCPLLEQNRSLMELIMMIVWAFVSLRIILKA